MKLGDCLKFYKPGYSIPHCYFVIAENTKGNCVIANMTTMGHICDKTVILHAGDHPEVKHDSIVLYSDAQITTFEILDALVKCGSAQLKAPCSPALLKKLQEGAPASSETKDHIREFLGHPPRNPANPKPISRSN